MRIGAVASAKIGDDGGSPAVGDDAPERSAQALSALG